jgi:hypothetical protein
VNGQIVPTHNVPELGCTDLAVVVFVKDLEGFHNLFFRIGVFHLAGHHGEEFRKIDRVVTVGVDLFRDRGKPDK